MISVFSTEQDVLELEVTAFPKPDANRTSVAFHSLSSLPEYVPVLVEITSKVGDVIKYKAVDAGDKAPVLFEHELDLTRLDDVWPRLPSTLHDWDPIARPCALLFLSESYLEGGTVRADGRTERQDVVDARPKVMGGGCQKWPCAAGDLRESLGTIVKLKVENAGLQESVTKLADDNAKLKRDYDQVAAEYSGLREDHAMVKSIYASLKDRVTKLQPTFSPDQLSKIDLTLFP